MTRVNPIPSLRGRIFLLYLAFSVIIIGFVLANLIAVWGIRRAQADTRLLVDNMLVSVKRVARLTRDLDEERLLINAHIFEKLAVNMERTEQQIATVDADFAATAHAYEPIASTPVEHAEWEFFQSQVKALRAPLNRILAMSRENQDLEAQQELMRLNAPFGQIDATASKLIAINHEAAKRTAKQIATVQHRSLLLLGAITVSAMFFALLVMLWRVRVMQQQDELWARDAMLLEQRNRELDAFAGRVAHDLRRPLNTISLAASRLAACAPQEEGTAAILQRGIAQMGSLIHDLLQLATVQAKPLEAVTQTTRVVAALEEQLRAQVASIHGILRIDVEPEEVQCSEGLLRQVLWNLGENAVKYRRPDQPLELSIFGRAAAQRYEFRITDNGQGMTPEDARQAFEPFFRGKNSNASEGTGIGLTIVKRVLDVCGGTVSISSQVGQGTTFFVNLRRRGRASQAFPQTDRS